MTDFADLVIIGAPVYTVDAAGSWTDAVAVRRGRIVGLGAEMVADLTGPATQAVHQPGGLVLPGFIDAHVHPPMAGRNRLHVDLSGVKGRVGYLAYLADYVRANPDRDWILGGGWAMEHFPNGLPVKADLDSLCPDRPVFLFNRDVHGAWVNSEALRRAGIDRTTPDPPDGRIERDPVTGEPTGVLHEGAAYAVNARLVPTADAAEWQAALLNAQAHLQSLGVTSWQDAWVTDETLAAYTSLAGSEALAARVTAALWWDRDRGLEQVEDLLTRREAGAGPGVWPTTVKIMIDGVLENQTGALLEPYCDGCGGHTDNQGLSFLEPDLLAAAVTRLDGLGFAVHMHAIGDRAVRYGLDAVAAARKANGVAARAADGAVNSAADGAFNSAADGAFNSAADGAFNSAADGAFNSAADGAFNSAADGAGGRHHIAHLQVINPADLPRFRQLGVAANMQAFWAQHEPQMDELTAPFLGPDRTGQQYPFGSLHASGAVLAMGSDWGVTTADPLQQLEVAVRRVDPANRANPAFLPDQRLSLPTAVRAFTAGSAWVNGDPDGGSLQIGKRADLVVLDRNVFARPAAEIADARVVQTVASGRVVYAAQT